MMRLKNNPGKFFFILLALICICCEAEISGPASLQSIEPDPVPTCESAIFFADKCVNFEIKQLSIITDGDQFAITNNVDFKVAFAKLHEAEKALKIIEHYQFNEYCIIGADTSFSYFLTESEIPSGAYEGEDCIMHNLCDLEVKLTWSGKYTVVEPRPNGEHWMYGSNTQETTYQILQTLQYYESSFGCYVGRPYTKMHYMRK